MYSPCGCCSSGGAGGGGEGYISNLYWLVYSTGLLGVIGGGCCGNGDGCLLHLRWWRWRICVIVVVVVVVVCLFSFVSGKLLGDSLVVQLLVAMTHALVVVVMISAGQQTSIAHLNLALTLGLTASGHMTILRSILYVVDQLLASALACALVKYLTGGLVEK
ncbi:aquaporin TIP4-1-like isoform X2 [Papaver somniferum]|uniref:aquaporin TIP4-1-like isoform X2 n=1 Tax=Papaver somniferum TaxID=3469 RepID=UPI000E6FCE33|nr:aquaporin TIP4-1-like isoform X2 [Papaver somniferum]